jgi:hypothetical protein
MPLFQRSGPAWDATLRLANGLNPCEVRREVEMLPVVPAENPPSGLRPLQRSGNVRRGDARAAGRIELADAAALPQRRGS